MVKTCHSCHGSSDGYKVANLKRCAGCQRVYYCSTACQKHDWIEHIFHCKPHRPINTADYLALAVRQSLPPEHFQTCEDYGFNRAWTGEEKYKLLGLYTGLLKGMEIPPKTIHDWRVRGVLVDEIKAAFFKIPERFRGVFFPWFLQNEHVVALAGLPLPQKTMHDSADAMLVRTWRFIGGSERDSLEQIRVAIESKPDEDRACYLLYTLLLAKEYPSPRLDVWVDFGYASCKSQQEETDLSAQYHQLSIKYTFQEFCDAFRARRLLDLFDSQGLQVKHRDHLQDLLHSDRVKSVWFLKQFVIREVTPDREFSMRPAVMMDYGFVNCRNDSERRQLKRVYKAFFENHGGDPMALHEAAIKGNIHGYLSKVVQGLRDPKFQRLMKNVYPLPNFQGLFI